MATGDLMNILKTLLLSFLVFLLLSCTKDAAPEGANPNFSGYPETPFTIHDEAELIGGPVATGKIGDILLSNDKIKVIIQKPIKNSFLNSFGGVIIDADRARQGMSGEDNFGSVFPMFNIEWTVNYYDLKVISDGKDGGTKIVRALGIIDAYDYLDLDFIGAVAKSVANQEITYPNRFDDRGDPFNTYSDLKGFNKQITTDYILEPGKNYVRVETTITNNGEEEIKMPVGIFVNNSGQNSLLIPGIGFTPSLLKQAAGNTGAIIFPAFDGTDVSYGIFYDHNQFETKMADGKKIIPQTASITYSSFTAIAWGEGMFKLLPLGKGGSPEINFSIPAGENKRLAYYFVVGDGSGGSVLDSGIDALELNSHVISGKVTDKLGKPVADATVAVQNSSTGGTVITYRTDSSGNFSGKLPYDNDPNSQAIGSGKYKVMVNVEGYQYKVYSSDKSSVTKTSMAGKCDPDVIDLTTGDKSVSCVLGESGVVKISSPVKEEGTGKMIPARLTVVGIDPTPNEVGDAGNFYDTLVFRYPYNIAAVKYITAKGTLDLTGKTLFSLEPGIYKFVISRGMEYSSFEKNVEIKDGETFDLGEVVLKRVNPTPGYVSADMHVHCINSPDSSINERLRVLTASAEGLDILQSTDHDFITDYSQPKASLEAEGLIPPNTIQTSAGDEITPNHYGHIQAYPLIADDSDPDHGAVDWSDSDLDEVSPKPDYGLTVDQIIERVKENHPERIIQINHIMDMPTGMPLASGWVTSHHYNVPMFSTYGDPVEQRMPAASSQSFPLPLGTSGLFPTSDFDVLEIAIGMHLHNNEILFRSALPTWFNMLNLGRLVTAVADSDSHTWIAAPIGIPRNFIAHSVDPSDQKGNSHADINLTEYAQSIRDHRVVVSAGPFISIQAKGSDGESATVGDTIVGRAIDLDIKVTSPSWAWFDTVDIFVNTDPIPVDDMTDQEMKGTAADPAQFFKPYHMPRYTYQPIKSFSVASKTLSDWKDEGSLVTASLKYKLTVDEDSWVVVVAKGTKDATGFKSLFPIVTEVLVDPKDKPEPFDVNDPSKFHSSPKVGASAWALTNPIFIDADGNGFKSKFE